MLNLGNSDLYKSIGLATASSYLDSLKAARHIIEAIANILLYTIEAIIICLELF